jgi:peptidyl-tRNA hydrolase, PTH1 family
MSLFQNRPQSGDTVTYYTVGQSNTVLVVGLGNPGAQYEGTRHNAGFAAVDRFARDNSLPAWIEKRDLKCHLTTGQLGETRVIVMKPTTFMNLSGEAVQAVVHFYKVQPDHIIAAYDELDIPFGQIRTRFGGSAAGHNGVKSLIQHLGENFGRVRIGIGPKVPEQMDTADFVLQKFSSDQEKQMPALTREASAILSEYVFGGGQLLAETRSFL